LVCEDLEDLIDELLRRIGIPGHNPSVLEFDADNLAGVDRGEVFVVGVQHPVDSGRGCREVDSQIGWLINRVDLVSVTANFVVFVSAPCSLTVVNADIAVIEESVGRANAG